MDEKAGDAARARVDIFVGTKYSKIDAPVMHREGHVSNSMRKIPSTDTTLKSKTISTRNKNKEVKEESEKPNYIYILPVCVEKHENYLIVGLLRDGRHGEPLSSIVLNSTEQYEGDRVTLLLDDIENVPFSESKFSLPRR